MKPLKQKPISQIHELVNVFLWQNEVKLQELPVSSYTRFKVEPSFYEKEDQKWQAIFPFPVFGFAKEEIKPGTCGNFSWEINEENAYKQSQLNFAGKKTTDLYQNPVCVE